MGSVIGKTMKESMDENMRKNQEFMLATQRTTMERQMNMQRLMFQKQMATQVAWAREMFDWIAAFYTISSLGMFVGFAKTKRPGTLVPFVPLSFIVAYQAHLAYGNKIQKIRAEAEHILTEEMDLVKLPGGKLSFDEVEKARLESK